MSLTLRAISVALMCALLAACAATNALESQSQPLSAQSARIYILRPGAVSSGSAIAANVTIDGADVGSVANNSYFFVDRPSGRHKIEMKIRGALAGVEYEAQVDAGRTYYFAFNATGAAITAGRFIILHPGPTEGQKVGQSSFFSNGHLAELDVAAGAEMVERMNAQAQAQRAVHVGRSD